MGLGLGLPKGEGAEDLGGVLAAAEREHGVTEAAADGAHLVRVRAKVGVWVRMRARVRVRVRVRLRLRARARARVRARGTSSLGKDSY